MIPVVDVHVADSADPAGVPVAVCQLAPRIGDLEGNRQRMRDAVLRAAELGARLVVLPELVSSGYVFADVAEARSLAEPLDGPTVTLLTELAREHGMVIVAGIPELAEDTLFNSAVLVDHTGLRAAYRKVHLWDRESDVFTPGTEAPPVVETEVGRVGVMVCYDLEFPEWSRLAAVAGSDIIAAPTNWPAEARPTGERPMEVVRVQANASVNRVFVAVADRVGAERGVEWVGGSAIVGMDGYPLAGGSASDTERVLVASCDLARARDKRTGPRNDVFADRRVELYGS